MCRSFDPRRWTNVQTDECMKIENPGVGWPLLGPAKIYTDPKEMGQIVGNWPLQGRDWRD